MTLKMTARLNLVGICKHIIPIQPPIVPPKMYFSDFWKPDRFPSGDQK